MEFVRQLSFQRGLAINASEVCDTRPRPVSEIASRTCGICLLIKFRTLASIQKDVQAKLDRSFTRMLAFNSADVTKIIDYRLKVREAVTKFEVSSTLSHV